MNPSTFDLYVVVIAMLALMITGYITPFVAKRGVIFGIQFGDKADQTAVRELKYKYKLTYSMAQLFFLILSALMYFTLPLQNVALGTIFIQVILIITIFVIFNVQAARLKSLNAKPVDTEVVVVDTSFDTSSRMVSPAYLIPSLVIVVLNILVPVFRHGYDWGAALKLSIPGVIIFITSLLVYYSIKTSKQQLDPNYPRTSAEQDQEFRYRWSIYIIAFSILVPLFSLVVSLESIDAIHLSDKAMLILNMGLMLLILFPPLVLAMKTGQSGSLIQPKEAETSQNVGEYDRDKFWKYGLFYVNRQDPSIFIAKRMGIGWTINFGNPLALFGFFIFLIMIIAIDSLVA